MHSPQGDEKYKLITGEVRDHQSIVLGLRCTKAGRGGGIQAACEDGWGSGKWQ